MEKNQGLIAGVDEAGRGPLMGPVVACAVILNPEKPIKGLTDSKKLTESQREIFYEKIISTALCYGIGMANVAEIDELNILHATMLAMQRAVMNLTIIPNKILVDGDRCPDLPYETEAIVEGDLWVDAISAASIVAKVTRDRQMRILDQIYPGYDLAANKGYGTPAHLKAIAKLGVTPEHRKSFAPVREQLNVE